MTPEEQARDLVTECFKSHMGAPSAAHFQGFFGYMEARIAHVFQQTAELEAMLLRINEHVFPGCSDSVDGLKRLVRERDQYYNEAKQAAERVHFLEGELKKALDGQR